MRLVKPYANYGSAPEALAETAGKKFPRGVVLYDGDAVVPFGERMLAAPLQAFWDA